MSRKRSGTGGSGRLASTAPAAASDSWPAWSEVWPEPPPSLASKPAASSFCAASSVI